MKDRGTWQEPPPKPAVPDNARGLVAQSSFWHMSEADQARHKAGWWANYYEKPLSPTAKPAFQEGWREAEMMLRGPRYRFTLRRELGGGRGVVLFCMLNPSTADDITNDPTIRRCMGFARLWGYAELRVVNLFAARSTKPTGLREMKDPVGGGNDALVGEEIEHADLLVAAWGATGGFVKRKREFLGKFGHHEWMCLGQTKEGHPKHPLYLKRDTELAPLDVSRFMPTEGIKPMDEKPLLKELPKPPKPKMKLRLVKGVPVCPIATSHFYQPDGTYVKEGPECGRPAVHVCPDDRCNVAFCSTHIKDHGCQWAVE